MHPGNGALDLLHHSSEHIVLLVALESSREVKLVKKIAQRWRSACKRRLNALTEATWRPRGLLSE